MKFHIAINLERMSPHQDMIAIRDHTQTCRVLRLNRRADCIVFGLTERTVIESAVHAVTTRTFYCRRTQQTADLIGTCG